MCISPDHTAGVGPVRAKRLYEDPCSPFGCLQDPEMHIPPWYWFSADHDELFSMIAGLGFGNQRSRALLSVASAVMRAGAVPPKLDDLMVLPQVGMYCAHAVACFGFAQRVPIVDSNVIRVFSRIAGIEPPKDIRRAPEVWKIAQHLLPEHSFVEHNYGLLDFCAAVCKPRVPSCVKCPIAANCAHEQRLGTATAQAWGRSYQ